MNTKKVFKLIAISAILSTAACSMLEKQDPPTNAVGENAVFNVDRAPAFVDTKSMNANQDAPLVDKLSVETQADYHFALAETYSFEGLSQKAIEEFKTTLIYDPSSQTVKMRLAVEYVKLGLVSEAVKAAEEVVQKDPKHVEAKLLLGGLYSTLKLFDKSVTQYTDVIKIDPKSAAEANLYLGAIYAEKNDLKKAQSYFEKVASSKNTKFKHLAYYYIGRIQVYGNKNKLAEESLKKSISAKPDFTDAVLALGSLFEETNKTAQATQLYSSYQEQYGPDISVAKALSQIYLESENYEKAYGQYEIILASEPENLNIKIRLALLDIEKKDYSVAIRRLKEILSQAPDSDKVRFYLAAVFEELNQNKDAIEQFEKIPAVSQFYGESVVHAAYLYRQAGDNKKAMKLVETAIENRKDYPQFYALQASLFDEQKKYSDAEKVLVKAAELFPENEQLIFFLGSTQDKLGKRQETVVSMKKVLKINADHVQAMNYLAYTYAELGTELPEAESLARKALKQKPNDAYIKDTLGWILYKQGKLKEAVATLENAHQSNPEESVIAEHLGDAYYQYQLFTKAKDMYERAARVEKNEDNVRKLETKIDQLKKMLSDNYKRVPASY